MTKLQMKTTIFPKKNFTNDNHDEVRSLICSSSKKKVSIRIMDVRKPNKMYVEKVVDNGNFVIFYLGCFVVDNYDLAIYKNE